MQVQLPFWKNDQITEAAVFIAELVRQGVLFSAVLRDEHLEIEFTGGF